MALQLGYQDPVLSEIVTGDDLSNDPQYQQHLQQRLPNAPSPATLRSELGRRNSSTIRNRLSIASSRASQEWNFASEHTRRLSTSAMSTVSSLTHSVIDTITDTKAARIASDQLKRLSVISTIPMLSGLALVASQIKNKGPIQKKEENWYCCDLILRVLSNPALYEHCGTDDPTLTLCSLIGSLCVRSRKGLIGNAYGEPYPGQRYIMLHLDRDFDNEEKKKTFVYVVDNDQSAKEYEFESLRPKLGPLTWCAVVPENHIFLHWFEFKFRKRTLCCKDHNVKYRFRYHVSNLPAPASGEDCNRNDAIGEAGAWIQKT